MSNINLHLGDCLEAMKEMPDNSYELAIVDPPYGLGISKNSRIGKSKKHTPKDWDDKIPTKFYFEELKRISKRQIIWGVNYFDGMGLNGGRIIWNKLGKNIGRRKVPSTFSECEIAYYSDANNVKMYSYTSIGNVQGNDYKILWSDTNRIHPTQKPVKLYEWLLDNYAKEGDKILDTHLGSGSIALACHNRKFDLDAWEIDEEYYNNAVERLDTHKSQLTIFDVGG